MSLYFFQEKSVKIEHHNELTIANIEQDIMRGGPCQFWYCAFAQHGHLVMWTPLKKVLVQIRSEIVVWK
jgi:hypothetical protein